MYALFSYSLALILLYGGHPQLPSKFTLRFPASHNSAPQHVKMFPDIITYSLVVAALFKMASVKKAVKSKGAAKT